MRRSPYGRYARNVDRRTVILIATLACSLLIVTLPGWCLGQQLLEGAAEAGPSPTSVPVSAEEIAARATAVATEIANIEQSLEASDETMAERARYELAQLRSIAELLRKQADIAASTAPEEEEVSAKPVESLPISVYSLNALYQTRFENEARTAGRKTALSQHREQLTAAKDALESAERDRRKAKRAAEESTEPVAKAAAERVLTKAKLASRLARERFHLITLQVRKEARQLSGAGADETAQLDQQIANMRDALKRGEGDLEHGAAALGEREREARRLRETLARDLATTELRLAAAQKRLADQSAPSQAAIEELKGLQIRVDAGHRRVAIWDEQMQRLLDEELILQQWNSALRGTTDRSELEQWLASVTAKIAATKASGVRSRESIEDLQLRATSLDSRLVELPEGSPEHAALTDRRSAVIELQEAERSSRLRLANHQRVLERFQDELHEQTGHIDLMGLLRSASKTALDIWTYELTVVEDSAITVGSAITAILLVLIGLFASRRGSSVIGRLAEDRFHVDAGAAHALQTLSFYALLVTFTLFALRAVHFPLTIFTVLGGALAIGIGFGSQNVMNNFISGLILMLERPVRARDVIEVDGNHGTIEKIGARSTQIRSTDGRHIIVPNSFFLESNVVNWTLSDDMIRAKVSVGVIYGSPTRLVGELIKKVVDENEHVLNQPKPIILFEDFGDNSLNFEVHFWVRARSPMLMKKIQSEVRFRIDDLFREHTLVIAFPQRDVHLDSVSPIEIKVVGQRADQEKTEEG